MMMRLCRVESTCTTSDRIPVGRRVKSVRTMLLLLMAASTPTCVAAERRESFAFRSAEGRRQREEEEERRVEDQSKQHDSYELKWAGERDAKAYEKESPERNLKELESKVTSGRSLLGECQGDCNFDWECEGDLVCFQRDGYTSVPNCAGIGRHSVDYCHYPTSAVDYSTLTFLGARGKGELGLCSGDCDWDSDCRDGLECFDSPGIAEVPGCTGERLDGKDYCFDPDNLSIPMDSDTLVYVGKGLDQVYGRCIGDCRVNADCRGDLECYEEEGPLVPGCLGVRQSGVDYCYDPREIDEYEGIESDSIVYSGTLASVDNDFVGRPLPSCFGDCDRDSDCESGLKCAQRPGDGTYYVHGCKGTFEKGIEYCYDPNWDPSASALANGPLPTLEPSPNPTAEPTIRILTPRPSPAPSPTPTTTAPTLRPTDLPTKMPTPRPTDLPTTLPTVLPTSTMPVDPVRVFIQLSPFVLELVFLTPRRLNLIINESIDENIELLHIVGGALEEGIRSLNPSSYFGVLLEARFLDEVGSDKGATKVSYEFTGKAIFVDSGGFTIPSSEEVEDATLNALDEDVLFDELRQSGDIVLEAVQAVSLYLVDDAGSGVGIDNLPQQEDGGSNDSIKIGAFVLVAVIVGCAAVIGGAYFYMKRQDNSSGFWRRPGRDEETGRKPPAIAAVAQTSKRIMGAFPSPTKTSKEDLSFESDNEIYLCEGESGVESELSIPDFGDASSVGALSRTDWSYTSRTMGYSCSGNSSRGDASGSARAITPKAPSAEAFAASSSAVVSNDEKGNAVAQSSGHTGGDSVSSSHGASVSTTSMGALAEIGLMSVLQIDDDRFADVNGSSESNQSSGKESPKYHHPDFGKVWKKKKSGRKSPTHPREESPHSPSTKEQIVLHVSESPSSDAEDILRKFNRPHRTSSSPASLR